MQCLRWDCLGHVIMSFITGIILRNQFTLSPLLGVYISTYTEHSISRVIVFVFNHHKHFLRTKWDKNYVLYLPRYLSELHSWCSKFFSVIIFFLPKELSFKIILEQAFWQWISMFLFVWKFLYFTSIPEGYFHWM